jgi:hypothetical protein
MVSRHEDGNAPSNRHAAGRFLFPWFDSVWKRISQLGDTPVVMPMQMGIQQTLLTRTALLDSRLRENDAVCFS